MIRLMSNYSKLEFCSMFHYGVAMTFVYELVYIKIAPKTFIDD